MNFVLPRLTALLPVVGIALLTGACGAPLAVTGASYAADGAFLVASDKTSTDHLVSVVSEQDCALWRVLRGRAVCKPREGDKDPYKVDYNEPQRQVAEDGVRYAPPLRPAPDTPPSSWDAAAYKTPPVAPTAPVTAVAEAPPEPPPSAAPAPAKPAKPKIRSVRKPSQGRAAPAS
ncbi:MAG: hypothetical protein FJX11_24375 [Alphaproteobacteria bacterium]|nr:hypothetical protein [Alphaproteobacteria bacterium]